MLSTACLWEHFHFSIHFELQISQVLRIQDTDVRLKGTFLFRLETLLQLHERAYNGIVILPTVRVLDNK